MPPAYYPPSPQTLRNAPSHLPPRFQVMINEREWRPQMQPCAVPLPSYQAPWLPLAPVQNAQPPRVPQPNRGPPEVPLGFSTNVHAVLKTGQAGIYPTPAPILPPIFYPSTLGHTLLTPPVHVADSMRHQQATPPRPQPHPPQPPFQHPQRTAARPVAPPLPHPKVLRLQAEARGVPTDTTLDWGGLFNPAPAKSFFAVSHNGQPSFSPTFEEVNQDSEAPRLYRVPHNGQSHRPGDLAPFVSAFRHRFSCEIGYAWLSSVLLPKLPRLPIDFLERRGSTKYRREVRDWVSDTEGPEIWVTLQELFYKNASPYDGNRRYTIEFLWTVFLVREILLTSVVALESGALVRLGASSMLDPCHQSFDFEALKNGVWQVLKNMADEKKETRLLDRYVSCHKVRLCSHDHCRVVKRGARVSKRPHSRPKPVVYMEADFMVLVCNLKEDLQYMFGTNGRLPKGLDLYFFHSCFAGVFRQRAEDIWNRAVYPTGTLFGIL